MIGRKMKGVSSVTIDKRIKEGKMSPEEILTVKRRDVKGHHSGGKLTEKNVKDIISIIRSGEYTLTAISKLFAVSRETISLIKRGKMWTDITKGEIEIGELKIIAFGEEKSMEDWVKDERCEVFLHSFKSRLYRGMSPEKAMRRKDFGKVYEAFGEEKQMYRWLNDSRCVISGNMKSRRGVVEVRMRQGWNLEKALSTKVKKHHEIEVFGEIKNMVQWTKDERCKVGYITLLKRIKAGWEPEKAMTFFRNRKALFLEVFGEIKSLKEWSRDERCKVGYGTLQNRLNKLGNETAAVSILERERKKGEKRDKNILYKEVKEYEAFGESQSLSKWESDDRCKVSATAIVYRIKKGWEVEKAITTPAKKVPLYIKAFGEIKTVAGWVRDDRCSVCKHTLKDRIRRYGWEPEKAVKTPARNNYNEIMVEIYGEKKNLTEWGKDSRCNVSHITFGERLRAGWRPEKALTYRKREKK